MSQIMNQNDERIRHRAYQLWEQDGRPEGREREHWERACRLIEEEDRKPEAAGERSGERAQAGDSPAGEAAGLKRRAQRATGRRAAGVRPPGKSAPSGKPASSGAGATDEPGKAAGVARELEEQPAPSRVRPPAT